MAANYQGFQFNSPTQQPIPQQGAFQSQQFFPQPQGNVYLINNSLEMANVPTGVGVSVAICLSEGVMYLKTMQNGNPMFVSYKIQPFEKEPVGSETQPIEDDRLKEYINRLEMLENEINTLKKRTGYNLSELTQ